MGFSLLDREQTSHECNISHGGLHFQGGSPKTLWGFIYFEKGQNQINLKTPLKFEH